MNQCDDLCMKRFGMTMDELGRIHEANTNHPELEKGEMFYHNGDQATFDRMDYYTVRRLGRIAYDADGNIIPGLFPIFIQKAEFKERMARFLVSPT